MKRAQDRGRVGKPVPLGVLASFQQGKDAFLNDCPSLRSYWSGLEERRLP